MELREQFALLAYATRLLDVEKPEVYSIEAQLRLSIALNKLIETVQELGAPAPGKVEAA